ncbi:ABC transporter ATP-binding protein [Clostridium sp. CF012]|uniref:ABC transporter ATP-binding protein n=1 Tax=Clostridium sp. CF012 TaxID=2843319 RepID=UPI001C0BDD19|nr:ABC transporter ATP-binding protein [Clostridium sp. CF012]MBU3144029.1 ABC transporter ATP-binding protein [Clostridium sp. CF012]
MEPILCVENFSKFYGDKKAIDNISFKIYPGEIFALLGPNGAGKTSTLECIEGIKKSSKGTIAIKGINPEKEFFKIKDTLGVQLQASALPEIITVEEAMKMFCLYSKTPIRYDLLRKFDLMNQCNMQFGKLSTGQQRKLVLAIALAHNPELLILDEPTAALDASTRVQLHNIMREERKKGTAILLASHDMTEVEDLADNVAILLKGKIIESGSPRDIITSGKDLIKIYVKTKNNSIASLNPVQAFKIDKKDEYMIFHCKDIEELLQKILEHTKANNDKLLDLKVERASLEERFIDITRTEDFYEGHN